MVKLKIAFFEITDLEKERYTKELSHHNLLFFEDKIQNVNIEEYKDCDIISVFIYSKLTKEVINNCPNLKLVTTRSTGMDHIDYKYCAVKKIDVKNVPSYGENTVAEHGMALLLSLSRKIEKSMKRIREEKEFSTEGLQGFDLQDKTIGLIGGGRIGLHMARMAKSFGMKVKVYDINKDDFMAQILGFTYCHLETLLKESDIISLHLPHNEDTHHMINKDTLNQMKDGVVIINTARGGLIDTTSLLDAIESGKVSGAGLDVVEGEELLLEEGVFNKSLIKNAAKLIAQNHKLMANENVVVTPHNGFNSVEAVGRIFSTTLENINEFIETNI